MRCTGDGNDECCPLFDNGICATSCSQSNHVAIEQNNYTCCKSYLFHCSSTYQINESIYLSIRLPLHLSVCLSVCLPVCLSIYTSKIKLLKKLIYWLVQLKAILDIIIHNFDFPILSKKCTKKQNNYFN